MSLRKLVETEGQPQPSCTEGSNITAFTLVLSYSIGFDTTSHPDSVEKRVEQSGYTPEALQDAFKKKKSRLQLENRLYRSEHYRRLDQQGDINLKDRHHLLSYDVQKIHELQEGSRQEVEIVAKALGEIHSVTVVLKRAFGLQPKDLGHFKAALAIFSDILDAQMQRL